MIDPDLPPASGPPASDSAADDLRVRLRALQESEKTARREARRLARELSLTRRLLKFSLDTLVRARPADGEATVLLSAPLAYHLDESENLGTRTALSGWAFRPAPGWDARATTVTVLLRHEDTVYATACRGLPRPDVAAFYAGQPSGASGGAVGLDGAGFACEIAHDALPAGTTWKIVLRLECGGRACEQFTGQFLRP